MYQIRRKINNDGLYTPRVDMRNESWWWREKKRRREKVEEKIMGERWSGF